MSESAWIDAGHKTPPKYESVIGWARLRGDVNFACHEVYFDGVTWCSVRYANRANEVTDITHWQKFPAGPQPA
jgi:hypothetical protein